MEMGTDLDLLGMPWQDRLLPSEKSKLFGTLPQALGLEFGVGCIREICTLLFQ